MGEQLFVEGAGDFCEEDRVVVILIALGALRIPGVHGVAGLVRERVHVGENVALVVHHDERRIAETRRTERAAALSFVFVAVAPAPAQAGAERCDVFPAERREGRQHLIAGRVPRHVGFDFVHDRHVGVVVVDLVELQQAAAQGVVALQRGEVRADGRDEVVVHAHRHVVGEKRGFAGARVVAGAGVEDVGLDRVRERGGDGEFVRVKLRVELLERAPSHVAIPLHEKRRKAALRQLALDALFIREHAKGHVHVGQLRKSLAVSAQRAGPEGEQALLVRGERVRLEAALLSQGHTPFRECFVGEVALEGRVIQRLDFRRDECRGLADERHQIFKLRLPREVLRVRAVTGSEQARVVPQSLDQQAQLLLKFQHRAQRRHGLADAALPLRGVRIVALHFLKCRLPVLRRRVEQREIPGIAR